MSYLIGYLQGRGNVNRTTNHVTRERAERAETALQSMLVKDPVDALLDYKLWFCRSCCMFFFSFFPAGIVWGRVTDVKWYRG